MRLIAQESAGTEQEPLFRETLTRFGGKRLTEEVAKQLTVALEFGECAGRLQRSPSATISST